MRLSGEWAFLIYPVYYHIFLLCVMVIITLMLRQESSLTWFEEWFMHSEYKWGRTLTRYWDTKKLYGPKQGILTRIVALKYQL
jgi:hypothetical protein